MNMKIKMIFHNYSFYTSFKIMFLFYSMTEYMLAIEQDECYKIKLQYLVISVLFFSFRNS